MRNLNWSAENRRSFFIWILFCAISGLTLLAYAGASLAAGRGVFVMPLDDVYIHFQYARQLANGQPYVYNPGLPPSSGATSFLYPYLLAIGYLLGFQGWNLGLWAMLMGYATLAGSAWLVYQLVRGQGGAVWLALCVALAFEINGSIAWHFMSGMETGIVVFLSLGVLFHLLQVQSQKLKVKSGNRNTAWVIGFATLMALVRPEGAVLAVLVVLLMVFTPPPSPLPVHREGGQSRPAWRKVRRWWGIPVLAVGVQPLVNLLLTGSPVASGNAAKSVLGIVPFEGGEAIRRIAENFGRIWWEFLTGVSPREGVYIAPLMLVVAGLGVIALFTSPPSPLSIGGEGEQTVFPRKWRWLIGLVLVGWLVGGTAMIATLDTAFWHFKRYQIPFMALLFPLVGWGLKRVLSTKYKVQGNKVRGTRYEVRVENKEENFTLPVRGDFRMSQGMRSPAVWFRVVVIVIMGAVAVWTSGQFWGHYLLNAGYVYEQPLHMARWLETNTPTEALVAVHDTGMMRYMGGRTTLDMVGLTTAGAADYWRNGPGSVAEFLMLERPDFVASYGSGHGFGLGMVADTAVYGELQAGFPVNLDARYNVALAANFQGIYEPDWATMHRGYGVVQASLLPFLDVNKVDGITGFGVNVADLRDEGRSGYRWSNVERLQGFPTEVHQFDYPDCEGQTCRLVDGGRLIEGEETFAVNFALDSAEGSGSLILVTRVHPQNRATFDVYVNEMYIGTRWVPEMPGVWLDIPTYIPAELFSNPLPVRIVSHDGMYMPYDHTIYIPLSPIPAFPNNPTSLFQDGAIVLSDTVIAYEADTHQMGVDFEWYTEGNATGDYVVFVHVYDDVNAAPIAQADMRPGNGTLPPGNWLPGVLRDTIMVDLNTIPTGKYQVAIGLYDPVTLERLMPTGGDEHGRLFIGDVEIKP